MLLQFVTKLVFTGCPFIDVNPFGTVQMVHFIPQIFKFHNFFDFTRHGGDPKFTVV